MEQEQPNKDRLTEKNKAFIQEYLLNGGNGTQAYLSVYQGVTWDSANSESARLLAKPSVKKFLKLEQDKLAQKQLVKREDVVQILKDLIVRCVQDDDRHHLMKAINEVNKMHGYHQDKPAVNIQTQGPIKIDFGGYDPDSNENKYLDAQDINYEESSGAEGGEEDENNED